MPRPLRNFEDNGIYHVFNRGNGRQRVFHKDGDYLIFLKLLGEMKDQYSLSLYAYCLMPNHFHLLVKTALGEELSHGMQWFMTTHARCYHQHYQSTGHLWQGRFKSTKVLDEDHFVTVARYVEGNAVRAGLVESAAGWVWSSHRGRCGLEEDSLVDPLPVAYPAEWTAFVDTPLTGSERAKATGKGTGSEGASPPCLSFGVH